MTAASWTCSGCAKKAWAGAPCAARKTPTTTFGDELLGELVVGPGVVAVLDDRGHPPLRGLNDGVLERSQRVADGDEPTVGDGRGHEDELLVLEHQLAEHLRARVEQRHLAPAHEAATCE
jgi:hypothetical protein